jgi:hypothetical protein
MTISEDICTILTPDVDKRPLGHMFCADQSKLGICRMVSPLITNSNVSRCREIIISALNQVVAAIY